jgi:putative ABC transport system permease protein
VTFHDICELASRNLRQSVLRNSLTTLGVAVGVASLVAMLSLGIGLQQLASKRLTRSGLFDTVIVSSRRDFLPRADRRAGIRAENSRLLDDGARDEISKIPHVIEVYPDIRFDTEMRYNDEPHIANVGGLMPSARNNEAFDTLKGSFFSSPEAAEAILMSSLAKDLDPKAENVIGKDIVIRYAERQQQQAPREGDGSDDEFGFSMVRREQKLKVIGILEQEPFGGFRGNSNIFVPMDLALKMNPARGSDVRSLLREAPNKRTYTTLTVRVDKPSDVQGVQDAVKKMGFSTFSLLDASRNLRNFFRVLDTFLGVFGSLALAVAALGIVNTLVMAILERRREIGIMKAIGASDADVRGLFFAEAAVMGALGGMLGVALGWAMGRIIDFGTNIYLRRLELPPEQFWIVPWWLVLLALVFSVLMTLAAGLYPATRAARLDPVQALRYE